MLIKQSTLGNSVGGLYGLKSFPLLNKGDSLYYEIWTWKSLIINKLISQALILVCGLVTAIFKTKNEQMSLYLCRRLARMET